MATLLDEWEADTDVDTQDYAALTDDHDVCNCGNCGRLLLARRHAAERAQLYAVTDDDTLPPIQYGWVAGVIDGRPHRKPICAGCYRAVRTGPVRYAV